VISVVIATYNRRTLLERTLRALEEQSLSPGSFEVVVADNGSTDGTGELLESLRAEGRLEIHTIRVTEPGKSFALNVAVTRARGEVLALTDDDVIPERGWLEALAALFERTDVDFAAGRILPLWEKEPPAWLSPALYGVLAVADGGESPLRLTGPGDPVMPIGANMAVRRQVVQRLGGWRTDLGKLRGTLRTGEDHEFYLRMLRAGCVGAYEPAARVRHLVPAERLQRSYFRRWFRDNGRIVALLEREFPTSARYVLGVPAYMWRQTAADLLRLSMAALEPDPARRFGHEVRLRWFLGYLQQTWGARRKTETQVTAQASALS
jgi:glycosyltransferase involved in cell wall biosynthesis